MLTANLKFFTLDFLKIKQTCIGYVSVLGFKPDLLAQKTCLLPSREGIIESEN